jgi:hypothetical protein
LGLKQAVFNSALPTNTIGAHLYIDYSTYLTIPKPIAYRTFFILRDPRDIAVSWYFAARNSHKPVGPIPKLRNDLKKLSFHDGLKYSIDSLEELGLFWVQKSWMNISEDRENVKVFRYENFASDNYSFLVSLFNYLKIEMPEAELHALYVNNSFERITKGRYQGTEEKDAHYRKGVSGDWKNYFDQSLMSHFRKVTGDLLETLGYAE